MQSAIEDIPPHWICEVLRIRNQSLVSVELDHYCSENDGALRPGVPFPLIETELYSWLAGVSCSMGDKAVPSQNCMS
jgi:hypothetical protein